MARRHLPQRPQLPRTPFEQSLEILSDAAGASFALAFIERLIREKNLMKKASRPDQNPLSRPQKRLLLETLKKLLGPGLVREQERNSEAKGMVLKNALNAIVLES